MDLDLRTVVISALLLMVAEKTTPFPLQTATTPLVNGTTSASTKPNETATANASTTTTTTTTIPTTTAPVPGFLNITWRDNCEGDVKMMLYHHSKVFPFPVCHHSETDFRSLFGNVCANKKGCGGKARWVPSGNKETEGYSLKERGSGKKTSCKALKVKCNVEVIEDLAGKLHAHKVVIALLCCVLLILILVRFTKPTVKALQKRLSDKRQSRWIGPTQSHSVSYHRGKTAVKNNEGDKRWSYPALERLAVRDSREPSSNRNSDCNY